jgi:RHS repeat-associated protein
MHNVAKTSEVATVGESDTETGLYYYRARYYDPAVGRLLNEDPIQFLGGNDFYRYADNRPINFRDPSGLCGHTGPCLFKAIKREALPFFADAIGAIPVEGTFLATAQLSVGLVAAIPQIDDRVVAVGTFTGFGIGIAGLSGEYGEKFAKAAPVIGNVISAALAVRDILYGIKEFQSCMAGE